MKKSAIKGPVLTLGAAAALGITLFSINVAKEQDPATPPAPAAVVAVSTPKPPPTTAVAPRLTPFPAKAKYHSDIPTKKGTLTVDITIDGAKATAYVCDNHGIEEWLAGSAVDGSVSAMSADGKSRLTGRNQSGTVVGNVSVGDTQWAFTAPVVTGYDDV